MTFLLKRADFQNSASLSGRQVKLFIFWNSRVLIKLQLRKYFLLVADAMVAVFLGRFDSEKALMEHSLFCPIFHFCEM